MLHQHRESTATERENWRNVWRGLSLHVILPSHVPRCFVNPAGDAQFESSGMNDALIGIETTAVHPDLTTSTLVHDFVILLNLVPIGPKMRRFIKSNRTSFAPGFRWGLGGLYNFGKAALVNLLAIHGDGCTIVDIVDTRGPFHLGGRRIHRRSTSASMAARCLATVARST